MKYLTGSYVEALALDTIPLQLPRRDAITSLARFTGEPDYLARPGDPTFVVGVRLGGRYYQRDGTGWTWTGFDA